MRVGAFQSQPDPSGGMERPRGRSSSRLERGRNRVDKPSTLGQSPAWFSFGLWSSRSRRDRSLAESWPLRSRSLERRQLKSYLDATPGFMKPKHWGIILWFNPHGSFGHVRLALLQQ
jgi:hypothetical protein